MRTENYAGVQMMRVHYSKIADVSGADHVFIHVVKYQKQMSFELAYFSISDL